MGEEQKFASAAERTAEAFVKPRSGGTHCLIQHESGGSTTFGMTLSVPEEDITVTIWPDRIAFAFGRSGDTIIAAAILRTFQIEVAAWLAAAVDASRNADGPLPAVSTEPLLGQPTVVGPPVGMDEPPMPPRLVGVIPGDDGSRLDVRYSEAFTD